MIIRMGLHKDLEETRDTYLERYRHKQYDSLIMAFTVMTKHLHRPHHPVSPSQSLTTYLYALYQFVLELAQFRALISFHKQQELAFQCHPLALAKMKLTLSK